MKNNTKQYTSQPKHIVHFKRVKRELAVRTHQEHTRTLRVATEPEGIEYEEKTKSKQIEQKKRGKEKKDTPPTTQNHTQGKTQQRLRSLAYSQAGRDAEGGDAARQNKIHLQEELSQ